MNKKELQDALRETKKQLKRYQDDLAWYSGGFEVLSDLRYHMNQVLDMVDSYNRFAVRWNESAEPSEKLVIIQNQRYDDAKEAAEKCENYFVKPIDKPSNDGIVSDTET